MSQSIKKKLMALIVVGAMAVPMVSFAQEVDKPVLISENQESNSYVRVAGIVSEVIDNEGNLSILVKADGDEYGAIFHLSEDVALWDRSKEESVKVEILKEGMSVEVFSHEHTPTTMSLPPQSTPRVIVIQAEEFQPTFVGEFNKDLVSSNNFLQLNIAEDTVIINEKGDLLTAEDIQNTTALVFYGMSTKSIPAQTSPSKVVVFAEKEEEEVKEMIALRETATELGYKVLWNHEDKSVELTKLNQTIVIKLDRLIIL